jgi:hypothetical protein
MSRDPDEIEMQRLRGPTSMISGNLKDYGRLVDRYKCMQRRETKHEKRLKSGKQMQKGKI